MKRFCLRLLVLVALGALAGPGLSGCAPITATYRKADVDLVAACRVRKAPGEEIATITCRSSDATPPERND